MQKLKPYMFNGAAVMILAALVLTTPSLSVTKQTDWHFNGAVSYAITTPVRF